MLSASGLSLLRPVVERFISVILSPPPPPPQEKVVFVKSFPYYSGLSLPYWKVNIN